MKLTWQCLAVFVALAMLATDAPKVASVEGVVTLNSMAPLRAVTIGLSNRTKGTSLQAATDTSGYYLFGEVRPGGYTIWADAKGYGCILIPASSCGTVSGFDRTLISSEGRLTAGGRKSKKRHQNEGIL